MAKNFRQLQAGLHAKMTPQQRAASEAWVRDAIQAMPLDNLREARQLTQTGIAQVMNVTQGSVSKMERRADMYISTLRSYVRAMGGEIEIRAIFADGQVVINQFHDLD